MKRLLLTVVLALFATPLFAATPVGIRVDAYSAALPTVSAGNTLVPLAEVVCDLAPSAAGASTVNPSQVEYTDDAHAGKVCKVAVGALVAELAPGTYSVKMRFTYADPTPPGTQSASSNQFTVTEAIGQGVRAVRP